MNPIREIGYYYAGGKSLNVIARCLQTVRDTPKDGKFFEVVEHKFKELDFVDAWGGSKPTLALLANWGLITQPGTMSFSYTSPEEIPFDLTEKGKHVLEQVAKEIDGYLRELVTEAAKSGKPIPKQSNVYEEIVKKGWEQVKKVKK